MNSSLHTLVFMPLCVYCCIYLFACKFSTFLYLYVGGWAEVSSLYGCARSFEGIYIYINIHLSVCVCLFKGDELSPSSDNNRVSVRCGVTLSPPTFTFVCMCVSYLSGDTSLLSPGRLHGWHAWKCPRSEPGMMRLRYVCVAHISSETHKHTQGWLWHNKSWALLWKRTDGAVSQYQGQGQKRRLQGKKERKKVLSWKQLLGVVDETSDQDFQGSDMRWFSHICV